MGAFFIGAEDARSALPDESEQIVAAAGAPGAPGAEQVSADSQAPDSAPSQEQQQPDTLATAVPDPFEDIKSKLADPEIRKRALNEIYKDDLKAAERSAEERGRQAEFTKRQQDRIAEIQQEEVGRLQNRFHEFDQMDPDQLGDLLRAGDRDIGRYVEIRRAAQEEPQRRTAFATGRDFIVALANAKSFEGISQEQAEGFGLAAREALQTGDWRKLPAALDAVVEAQVKARVEKEANALADQIVETKMAELKVNGKGLAPHLEQSNGSLVPVGEGSEAARLTATADLIDIPRTAVAAVLRR